MCKKLENMMKVKFMESQLLYNSMFVVYLSKAVVSQELFDPNAPWFEGTFGFIMPQTGCPEGYFWKNGTRSQLLDFFGNSVECLGGKACHFYGHEAWCFPVVDTHYCVKVHPDSLNPWPNGSYCINMYLECPQGFTEGHVYWDDNNIGSDENDVHGTLPAGMFDTNTRFNYCCRDDGNASTPVRFPSSKPFYLYRYKGECQQIADMNVTEETVQFITPHKFFPPNQDGRGGTHPDCSLDPILLHFCYYETQAQPGWSDKEPPCRPLNMPEGTGCSQFCLDRNLTWMLLVYSLTSSCF